MLQRASPLVPVARTSRRHAGTAPRASQSSKSADTPHGHHPAVEQYLAAARAKQARPTTDVWSYDAPTEPSQARSAYYETADGTLRPRLPLWFDPAASSDDCDVLDWSDLPADGWGSGSRAQHQPDSAGGSTAASAVMSASSGGGGSTMAVWGSSRRRLTWLAGAARTRSARRMRVRAAASTSEARPGARAPADGDEAGAYEGADAACPAGPLALEDVGHSDAPAAAEWDAPAALLVPAAGTPGHGAVRSSSNSSNSSSGKPAAAAKKAWGIVNGRWVAPSRDVARQLSSFEEAGADEGL